MKNFLMQITTIFISILLIFSLLSFDSSSVKPASGELIYKKNCSACHRNNGKMTPNLFPPLAKSDFLKDKTKTIEVILNGVSGKIVVNGKKYYGTMPKFKQLSDQEVVDVMNYILSSWGNDGSKITTAEVAKVRSSLKK